jgi:hypothetical protein
MKTPEHFRAQLKEALLAHADELAGQHVRHLPARRGRRALTWFVPSAAAALIAAAVATVIVASQGTSPSPASAATVLYASAAALQRSGPSLELGPHEYLYERSVARSRFIDPQGHTFLHEVGESWTARDGAGRLRDTVLNRAVISRHFDVRLGPSTARLRPSAHPFTLAYPVSLSYSELQRLPRSPKRLATVVGRLADRTARTLRESSFRSAHSEIVLYILRSIAVSPAPTAVRAAVYQVMASTPGIKLIGYRRDALGRRGDMFTATLGPMRAELIINPTSGRLLQFTRILMHRSGLDPGWRPGLISRDTYVEQAVVGSTTVRPH